MTKKRTIQALFFDFDGLIVETEGPIYQSWYELFQAHNMDLPLSRYVQIIGTSDGFDPLEELEEKIGKGFDRQALATRRQQREMELVEAQPVLPGIIEYLKDGRRMGLKLGVVSSSDFAWVSGHLQRHGLLEFFDFFRTRQDVELTKPDPALYLSALELTKLQPTEAIVFEDSLNGVVAAKAAGIFTVAVPTELTRDLDLSQADLRLDSCLDLPLEAVIAIAEAG